MKDFSQLKKNLKKDFSELKDIKIALLGDSATQLLTQSLRGLGYDNGLNLEIWEADFNQIEQQVYDLSSKLYAFKPNILILFQSSHKLVEKYNKLDPNQYKNFASNELEALENIYAHLTNHLNSNIIYYNYNEIDDSIFGNFANKTEASFLYQLRKLNYELMTLAIKSTNLYICDLSSIQNQFGKSKFFRNSVYVTTDIVLNIDILPIVASKTIDLINSLNGNIKKCVILDLDNTLWGGIIGDDGLENIEIGGLGIGKAFSAFQHWIKKLKNRGIIIVVCSKNTESVAKEPFEKHPDMVLRLDDISVFCANWENKIDNIHQIQKILNIGFDTMVFLDDNPFERNSIREYIPQICVPELPEDPADYLEFLYSLNLFETTSYTNEDEERTKQYQNENRRSVTKQKFVNEDDFLKSLNMFSCVQPFNTFNIPRAAQLLQRSNQFNLRTKRYTIAEIDKISISNNYITFSFSLEDKFGDNGLICIIILKTEGKNVLFIDTWCMSCRVLKRSMENFVLNTIVNFAKENYFTLLKGEYIPTEKNEMVKDHYHNLGFKKENEYWILDVNTYDLKMNYISVKK